MRSVAEVCIVTHPTQRVSSEVLVCSTWRWKDALRRTTLTLILLSQSLKAKPDSSNRKISEDHCFALPCHALRVPKTALLQRRFLFDENMSVCEMQTI